MGGRQEVLQVSTTRNVWAGIVQSVQRLATGWTVRGRIPVRARCSAPVQTGPGA